MLVTALLLSYNSSICKERAAGLSYVSFLIGRQMSSWATSAVPSHTVDVLHSIQCIQAIFNASGLC